MRKDQTDKHNQFIEVDKSDKHRYYKWGYKPLPTQTVLDEANPQFAIRSPEFKLPNPRGRLSRAAWRKRVAEVQAARQDDELEKLARNRKLFLPLDEIEEEWKQEFGLLDVNKLAKFNGIKRDLYQSDDVILKTWLDVAFNDVKIHRGNLVNPSQLLEAPKEIMFKPINEGSYHTLVVSNLDGHPRGTGKEVVHWMICNISGDNLQNSATIFDYLPPLPWQGTGYHRLVFSLYEQQSGKIQVELNCKQNVLKDRFMSSLEFASNHQLTPIGAAWCQITWDDSVSESWKLVKDLSCEPIFDWEEYIEPKDEQRMLAKRLSEFSFRNM